MCKLREAAGLVMYNFQESLRIPRLILLFKDGEESIGRTVSHISNCAKNNHKFTTPHLYNLNSIPPNPPHSALIPNSLSQSTKQSPNPRTTTSNPPKMPPQLPSAISIHSSRLPIRIKTYPTGSELPCPKTDRRAVFVSKHATCLARQHVRYTYRPFGVPIYVSGRVNSWDCEPVPVVVGTGTCESGCRYLGKGFLLIFGNM
jgi:hypothetical protein